MAALPVLQGTKREAETPGKLSLRHAEIGADSPYVDDLWNPYVMDPYIYVFATRISERFPRSSQNALTSLAHQFFLCLYRRASSERTILNSLRSAFDKFAFSPLPKIVSMNNGMSSPA